MIKGLSAALVRSIVTTLPGVPCSARGKTGARSQWYCKLSRITGCGRRILDQPQVDHIPDGVFLRGVRRPDNQVSEPRGY